jgi:hypothetical protein
VISADHMNRQVAHLKVMIVDERIRIPAHSLSHVGIGQRTETSRLVGARRSFCMTLVPAVQERRFSVMLLPVVGAFLPAEVGAAVR